MRVVVAEFHRQRPYGNGHEAGQGGEEGKGNYSPFRSCDILERSEGGRSRRVREDEGRTREALRSDERVKTDKKKKTKNEL